MKVGYIRVSSTDQNLERQYRTMAEKGVEKIFADKLSGKNTDRPELQRMMEFIREGDTVYIDSFNRLARNTMDLLTLVTKIQDTGASIVSVKEGFDLTTPAGKLMLTMLAGIAQFERECIHERQMEGIQIAKEKGVYKGRKPFELSSKFKECYDKWYSHKIPVRVAMSECGIKSRTTWYRLVSEYKMTDEYISRYPDEYDYYSVKENS